MRNLTNLSERKKTKATKKRWKNKRKLEDWGTWVAQAVKPLPSAQVMIKGSWDRAQHQAPCSAESLLLPLLVFRGLSFWELLQLEIFLVLSRLFSLLNWPMSSLRRERKRERHLQLLSVYFYISFISQSNFSSCSYFTDEKP